MQIKLSKKCLKNKQKFQDGLEKNIDERYRDRYPAYARIKDRFKI